MLRENREGDRGGDRGGERGGSFCTKGKGRENGEENKGEQNGDGNWVQGSSESAHKPVRDRDKEEKTVHEPPGADWE